jgi:hypothetical protein
MEYSDNVINEWEKDKNEFLSIFNINSPAIAENSDTLMNLLIDKGAFIVIEEPRNMEEFVNLFDTIITAFRSSGQDLPEYFDEPNICEDCEVIEILRDVLAEYYRNEADQQIMILDNVRDKYVVGIVPKQHIDQIYVLSFQLGLPLVDFYEY